MTKLTNIISLFAIFVSLLSVILAISFHKIDSITFDVTTAVIFVIPLLLNFYNRQETAKLVLIIALILCTIVGTIIFGYETYFKFAVIIPISLSYIFFASQQTWRLYLSLLIIGLYIVLFEISIYMNLPLVSDEQLINIYYNSLIYIFLIICYILLLSFLGSNLNEAEEEVVLYKRIFDNSHDGIALIDTNAKYIEQNKAHKEILGFSDEELKGQTPVIHMEEEAFNDVNIALASKGVYKGEIISNTKFGLKHIDLVSFSLMNDKNEPACFVGIKRDITEKKENEQKLKDAIAAKDKFFSIIAHDLKGPFHAIIGFSNFLLEDDSNYTDEEKRQMIKYINQSAQSTHNLLENLLDWARSQSNRIQFKPEKQNTSVLLAKTINSLRTHALRKDIKLKSMVKPDIFIYADKVMIETVVRNIVMNSIKFCNPGDTIEISATKNSNTANIEIKDTGIGISERKLSKLFKLEHNVSTKGTNNESGTGLGLILCKEFIEKNNGEISVESTKGKGTTFQIKLPLLNVS